MKVEKTVENSEEQLAGYFVQMKKKKKKLLQGWRFIASRKKPQFARETKSIANEMIKLSLFRTPCCSFTQRYSLLVLVIGETCIAIVSCVCVIFLFLFVFFLTANMPPFLWPSLKYSNTTKSVKLVMCWVVFSYNLTTNWLIDSVIN